MYGTHFDTAALLLKKHVFALQKIVVSLHNRPTKVFQTTTEHMKEYGLIQENGSLFLLDSNGNKLQTSHILDICGPRRVLALHGQMGAGKTTFIKQLCQEMGVEDVVNSPTFAIVNVYATAEGEEIYHFDCYRLKNQAEAIDFGAEEYLWSGNWCFVEWPGIIEDLLPEDTVNVYIEPSDEGMRRLRIE